MWPDDRVVKLVTAEFIPVRVHVRDQAEEFRRLGEEYGAQWTPAILVLDPEGHERHRIEGFLPASELVPRLEFGLGRVEFARGRFEEAERHFRHIADEHADSEVAPEALYWAGVSRYKASDDGAVLQATAAAIREEYPDSAWVEKASVWE